MHWRSAALLKDTNISRDGKQMSLLQVCEGPLVETNLIGMVPPIVCHVLQLLPVTLHRGHPLFVLQGAISL